jgi:Protein of unknown function (DUF1203)
MSENRQYVPAGQDSLPLVSTTRTSINKSSTFRVETLSPDRLEAMRYAGTDDGGNCVFPARMAQGGEPLRCCLRIAKPGEQMLLIAYRPFDKPSPYAETGPVFVHADSCEGYSRHDLYPDEFRSRQQVFRCYDTDGNILGGHLTEPTEDVEAVIEQLFADPTVEYIHTRNVIFGCYMLELRRSSSDEAVGYRHL